jgi:RimJ/RimL family protein N-acetyltransferase
MMPAIVSDQPEITTARLRLRRLQRADAALIDLYASDARLARMTRAIPHPYPPGLAETFVERQRAAGTGRPVWALDTGADDENGLIGLIALAPQADGTADVGYWVAPAFWNAGYAGEALEAVAAEAARRGIAALTAEVFQDNLASVRVLTRAGFAYEGEGKMHSVARGTTAPSFRYRRALRRDAAATE